MIKHKTWPQLQVKRESQFQLPMVARTDYWARDCRGSLGGGSA